MEAVGGIIAAGQEAKKELVDKQSVLAKEGPVRRTLVGVALLPLLLVPAFPAEKASPDFRKAFHLVGVPGVLRDERIDIDLAADALVFQHKKLVYRVPYTGITQVLLLRADRVYEKSTYAAAVAFGFPGALLILKKHKVDTVVVDFKNERGGRMGLAVQLEPYEGQRLREMLKGHGVAVDEPPLSQITDPKSTTSLEEEHKP
jgi:hypothetical protein